MTDFTRGCRHRRRGAAHYLDALADTLAVIAEGKAVEKVTYAA